MEVKFKMFRNLDDLNAWLKLSHSNAKTIIDIINIQVDFRNGRRGVHYYEMELG